MRLFSNFSIGLSPLLEQVMFLKGRYLVWAKKIAILINQDGELD